MNRPTASGFTLIEMSIVLVIIGLIVGAILVGQTLIKAALVRATATQLERFNTAVTTFKGKYDCIPGVCSNPALFGLPGIANTTYTLNSWTGAGTDIKHLSDFWGQLQAAGLLGDSLPGGYPSPVYGAEAYPGWVSPTCPMCQTSSGLCTAGGRSCSSGGWTLWNISNINNLDCGWGGTLYSAAGGSVPRTPYVWDLSRTGSITGGWGGVVTPADAAMLDQKIDDGKPLTGSMIAINDYTYSTCSNPADSPALSLPSTGCVNRATNSYATTSTGNCAPSSVDWGVDLLLPFTASD